MKSKIQSFLKKALLFITNPKLLLSFGIAWLITNGWAYILFIIGTIVGNGWLVGISTGYLSLLWLPCTPEKLLTIPLAIIILKLLFPKDKNTLALLEAAFNKLKEKLKIRRKK